MTTIPEMFSPSASGAPRFDHSSFPHSDLTRHSAFEFRHSPVSRAGTATLECTQIHNRTQITRQHATSPLRLLTPRTASPAALIYTSSFGGGLLAGDHITIDLTLHENATAYLASQSSTKIYRSAAGLPAKQSLYADVADDALLIVAPDPVVPYADSRYHQTQSFNLAPTASLILLDWCTAGRQARGELWHLADYKSKNHITRNGKRLLTDILHLSPNHGTLSDAFRMADTHCLATLVMLGPRVSQYAQKLLAYLATYPVEPNAPLTVAASPLADGILLRLAATSTERAAHALHSSLSCLQTLLGEHPWTRKW